MKYSPEDLLERIKEHVIKCAQIAWAAGNKSDTRIYNEMLRLLGLHDKGEEMIRFPVYPGKLWVRYPVGATKDIEVRVFEPGPVEKDFDSTLNWAEFEVKGFHDEADEEAWNEGLIGRWNEHRKRIRELEERNKYLEAALKNAGHVTTARKDQGKKADNMAHRNVSLQDRVSILEAEIEKLKARRETPE
jgi:hypothetical protein